MDLSDQYMQSVESSRLRDGVTEPTQLSRALSGLVAPDLRPLLYHRRMGREL